MPPFLSKLTTVEKVMIRKITTSIYVHSLVYGYMASKGHTVSLPVDMQIFTKLPLLPDEVGVLLIKNKNNSSKRYLACRRRVESALNGLVFGVPSGGIDSPMSGYKKYNGKNHISGIPLNGKHFIYLPNEYYWDVDIVPERLNTIPQEESFMDFFTIKTNEETTNIVVLLLH